MIKKEVLITCCMLLSILFSTGIAIANTYIGEIYFTLPDTTFSQGENISLKGYVYQANYTNAGTLVSTSSPYNGTVVNMTLMHTNGTRISNYTFTTDANGSFYSRSNYYPSAINITTPSSAGSYSIRAEYKDPNNTIWFSDVEISVLNKTIDVVRIRSEKATYNSGETIKIKGEAIKQIGDIIIYIANVSINGSLVNSSKSALSTFSCTTGENGKCETTVTAPSTYGNYYLEINNFKYFSAFSVVPFKFSIYMKDELGKSLKSVYALGERASIVVSISNASTNDIYNFSGYISDSAGNSVKTINSTTLNSNNSFTNSFLFNVDSLTFSYGSYASYVTVTKSGGNSISSTISFEVKDWIIDLNKRTANSGFEYEYSVFPNKTIYFEILPTYRINGSVIPDLNSTLFTVNLNDELNNIITTGNATWNSTCGKSGCYQSYIDTPNIVGKYTFAVTLSNEGLVQTKTRIIDVINKIITAQTTDAEGSLKELFGTNEYTYLSLTAYNTTTSLLNLSDAEIFSITYMNGTQLSYTKVNNFSAVNNSNSVNEWAWNSTLQRIKLDVPKFGGNYDLFIFGDNRSVGTLARVIVNPYDTCIVSKDTAGTVSSGYYYVWQFKTTDTIYFEIKATQANNPLGKAVSGNLTSGNASSYGQASGCSIDTTTKQAVTNATISVIKVRNAETGAIRDINTTASTCQASDSSGSYSCTVKALTSWEPGVNSVEFQIKGQDGTIDNSYGRFEARAFYLYGWSQTWQNSPLNNITLNVKLYEAGSGWWAGSGSSGGLSGTLTLKKIEYLGRDGEWLSSSVDSGYNSSNVSTSSVTAGSGSITVPVSGFPGGKWKTGNYRALIQGTTASGDTDYGYAWFGIKLWDVYGSPVECDTKGCNYKNYFNSKENVTLFIKISNAGDYNYNAAGNQNIGGNVTISVKKIEDCRTWPCKELNSTQYTSNILNINGSSPWYWNVNKTAYSKYFLYINSTTGSWGTGYYSVVLDINGTDVGNAWFNSIAFYVDAQPTNITGKDYVYSIKGSSPMYFNVTTTKSYKQSYSYNGSTFKYNETEYINSTVVDIVLRAWDRTSNKNIELNYPEDLNITPNNVTGNKLLNLTYLNGTWPSGYYWGELTLNNSAGEKSSGSLWFNVQPFRVSISSNSYNVDSSSCVNGTISVYDPDWKNNNLLTGNYSIISVYEDTWGNSGSSRTSYTNYTNTSFSRLSNYTICPNSDTNEWSSGSWGGYHYLNVKVNDNADNQTENGWLSFRTQPFNIQWGSISGGSNQLITNSIVVPINLTSSSTNAAASGNLTKVYQWRYDNYYSTKEEYIFKVGNCYSNVSGQCNITGFQNVTIYSPSGGWRVGYNYLSAEWGKQSSNTKVEDYSGVYFEGRGIYNGYYTNADNNSNWKYNFAPNENITIKINVRDSSNNDINVNITNVQYAYSESGCSGEWCKTYSSATWGLIGGGVQTSSGGAIMTIKPSSTWAKGYYYIKTSVSGSGGTADITGGELRVKDLTPPNITISSPINNQTINNTTFTFSATTTENSQCSLNTASYNTFNSWYCSGWNTTNGSSTTQKVGACNTTLYNYNGTKYYTVYLSNDYISINNGSNYWSSSASTGLSTGGTSHSYTFNVSNFTAQHYGVNIYCYDSDFNYKTELVAIKINNSGT
ncbi:MAG: hypothetical protein Q7R87_03230 [Nanoarchaeota archaeon]|nr:hypothetical protein [Nanoarchaeota archaeon]